MRIPHGSGSQGKQREIIAQSMLQFFQVAPQKPVIHTELLAPGGYGVRLVHHHQTDAAVAHKAMDVVGEQQFRRKVEQIHLSLAHLLYTSAFCSGERSDEAYATRM